MDWLRRAATLVDREPAEISLLLLNTQYGRRVLINEGCKEFQREHLSDWNAGSGTIKTTRELLKRKPDLAAFSAEFEAKQRGTGGIHQQVKLLGDNYDWSTTP
jgi:hypothetical protein